MANRFGADVDVEFLQDDMVGFRREPFDREFELYGKKLFTHRVKWGEVWLYDQSRRGTRYAGYVQDGRLYLDQSVAEMNDWRRTQKRSETVETLRPGRYLLWMDAWLRIGDYCYVSDGPFTTMTGDFEIRPWSAPMPPPRDHWQEITVTRPRSGSDRVCRIRAKSRRFHWLYRVSRILDVLNTLLLEHENQITPVGVLRTWAEFVCEITQVAKDSGTTIGFLPNTRQFHHYRVMRDMALNVLTRCDNFITFGSTHTTLVVPDLRKHINNVAMLLWNLIGREDFATEMDLFSPAFAEEHCILFAHLQSVFNKVPMVALAAAPDGTVTKYTKRFGYDFASGFTLQYYNQKLGFQLFEHVKPASTLKFLNSVRRYSISMLNNASIFFVRDYGNFSSIETKLHKLFESETAELQRLTKSKEMIAIWDRYTKWFAKAGAKYDFGLGGAAVMKHGAIQNAAAVENAIKDIRQNIEATLSELEGAAKIRDQKALSLLENKYPPFVYWLQSLETLVKFLYIFEAVNEFKKNSGVPEGAKIGLAMADTAGSALKSLVAQKLIKFRWPGWSSGYLGPVTIGRGLNFASDLGGAVLYTSTVYSDAYQTKLLDTYHPEDAKRIYAWNLVQWGGRWLVAIGSGGEFATGPAQKFMKANPSQVPGFMKKAGPAGPVLAALQGLGYLAQFAADIFGKQALEAAEVRRNFIAATDRLWQVSINVRNALDERTFAYTFYTEDEKHAMAGSVAEFEWAALDPFLIETRLKPYLAEPASHN